MFKNASHTPSFMVVVSCYKSGFSILNVLELILRAYDRKVPNRTAIFQDWAHQSFVCCLLYFYGQAYIISSQGAKGPISLCSNTCIADICIPFQIVGDSDPKILDTFDVPPKYSI